MNDTTDLRLAVRGPANRNSGSHVTARVLCPSLMTMVIRSPGCAIFVAMWAVSRLMGQGTTVAAVMTPNAERNCRRSIVENLACHGLAVQQPARTYWKVPVDSLAIGHTAHTHVEVSGLVTLVRHEGDGDTHIKIVGLHGFIVAECIPALPCRKPKVGERITVRGIARQDWEHKWYEVHPVEWLSP